MALDSLVRVAAGVIARAGWAPILVFLLHVFISRVLNGYILYPPLDVPMHFFGGLAMAYFLASCFAAVPDDAVAREYRPIAEFIFVVSLTATASVVWEFAEFTSDAFFGTKAQLGLHDTLLDMALGMLGGLCFMLSSWRRGTIWVYSPVKVLVRER